MLYVLKARDMRRKIESSLKGKSEAEQISIIEGYIADWPPNLRGEYVRMRRHLTNRLERLRTSRSVTATSRPSSDDPFVIGKTGHLTACLVGLPNAGKTHLFHRLGGSGATIADYPYSTGVPASHLATLDNLSIQVVDLPPVAEDTVGSLPYGEKLGRILHLADVLCVVLDGTDDLQFQELAVSEELELLELEPGSRPVLVVVNRASAGSSSSAGASNELQACTRLPLRTECDFIDILPAIARMGGFISAYAKPPGQSPQDADRLWVKAGSTVADLAAAVHRDLARRLTSARVWGESARQPGQPVSTEHALADADVVELLAR